MDNRSRLPEQDLAPRRAPSLATLVVIAAVSPLAINLFVPSIPGIADHFGAGYATIQLGLSLYLLATGLLQLFIGPLADRYGRRPILIGGLLLFLGGTALCVFAPTAELFLAGRLIQAASAVGMSLSRAIVRDMFSRERAASMIGYVIMGMSVAPMIGPAIGGFLDELFGWRASFLFLGAMGVVTLVLVLTDLPETNPGGEASMADQVRRYGQLLVNGQFWLYAGVAAFISAVFFAFLGGGPAVADQFMQLSPSVYGLYFALCAAGYMLGNFLSGRYAERVGTRRMMAVGSALTLTGAFVPCVLFSLGVFHPIALFGPMFIVGVGNGTALPSVMAAGISVDPKSAGAASGLLGALQIGTGGVMSIVAGHLSGATGEPLPMVVFMSLLALCGLVFAQLAGRRLGPG